MIKKPTISVIMGVYNGARFLVECIESVRNQSYEDFEFIIINDGSIDNTQHILDIEASKDIRMRIFKQQNQGLTKALNRAIKLSRGTYIARIDDGDIAHEHRLASQLALLQKDKNIVACGSYYDVINERGATLKHFLPPTTSPALEHILYSGTNPFVHGGMMMNKKVLVSLGGYRKDFHLAQDYDLLLRLVDAEYELSNVPHVLTQHRVLLSDLAKRPQQKYYAELALAMSKNRRAGLDDILTQRQLASLPKKRLSKLVSRALYYKYFKR